MRTRPDEEEFAKWLLKLGDGELPSNSEEKFELPTCCISDGSLVDEIFGREIFIEDVFALCNRAILCPKKEDCFVVNEEILRRLPGKEKLYTSVDEVECEDGEDTSNYPAEPLNSFTPSGMPLHKINLRIGAIVMLLRNLDANQCLCNGTRLIVRRLQTHTIDCEVATGSNKGNRVLIPRITMTINKSQGQTFDRLGHLLPQLIFSHGQLYVALSRVRSSTSIKVKVITKEQTSKANKTKNVVFKEIL
jgi:ATP-dependent DNA helicase PIF1